MNQPIAIITGATGGMGRAIASLFSSDHQLLLADVSRDKLDSFAAQLQQTGATVHTLVADISKQEDVNALVSTADAAGPIAALVHSAGLSPNMAEGRVIYEVNLRGTERLLQTITPYIRDGAAAVLIASQAGTLFAQNSCPELNRVLMNPLADDFYEQLENFEASSGAKDAYGFSKLGVQLLAIKYASRWGEQNARVISLSPGIIDTPMGQFEKERSEVMDGMIASTPLQRMGTSEEIARVARFLCSSEASFVTGVDLLVDGGATQALLSKMS